MHPSILLIFRRFDLRLEIYEMVMRNAAGVARR